MRRVRETFSFWSILGLLLFPELGWGQAPTIETTQISGAATLTPGSTQSRLGPMPGAGAMILGNQPGRDELLLGSDWHRDAPGSDGDHDPGTGWPGSAARASLRRSLCPPLDRRSMEAWLCRPRRTSEGPADGLTLDQAIERLIKNNYDLRSKSMEIPQARADILTASLRQSDPLRG